MTSMESTEKKSKIKILDSFLKAMTIIVLSSLPYIHDVITVSGEGLKGWVPDWGLQRLLTDTDGYILGFSSYRVFVYTILLHVFAHIGWVGWFFDARGKLYRPFLLLPVTLSLYQIGIILFNSRFSTFNEPNIKILLTLIITSILAINFYANNKKILVEHFKKKKLKKESN